MRYENGVVIAKSAERFFEYEKSGAKPNTLRVVPVDELITLARCHSIRIEEAFEGLSRVVVGSGVRTFERHIAGIFDVTSALVCNNVVPYGTDRVVLITWNGQ